jgi:hypothetical protein
MVEHERHTMGALLHMIALEKVSVIKPRQVIMCTQCPSSLGTSSTHLQSVSPCFEFVCQLAQCVREALTFGVKVVKETSTKLRGLRRTARKHDVRHTGRPKIWQSSTPFIHLGG